MSCSVTIKNGVKRFGKLAAVDGVSLDIKEGEFFTLLGPSGCGKTTLLRMIAGFYKIDEGELFFDEKMINNISANKRDIGMVFQNYAIFPHMSVSDNVAYGLKARKIKKHERNPRVLKALETVEMSALKDRMPHAMSGGQQQRVALARAFVIEPSILLMDEPLSNLDAKLRVQMRTMIKKLQSKLGITTIYVTHDQEEALAISDRIAVMKDGKLMQVGNPKEVYRKPQNLFVANFIGNSNDLIGEVLSVSDNNEGHVKLENGLEAKVVLKEVYVGKIVVSVRPEYFYFSDKGMPGKIVMTTFLGDFVLYEVELNDGQTVYLNEYKNTSTLKEIGESVRLRFQEEYVSVYKDTGEVISC